MAITITLLVNVRVLNEYCHVIARRAAHEILLIDNLSEHLIVTLLSAQVLVNDTCDALLQSVSNRLVISECVLSLNNHRIVLGTQTVSLHKHFERLVIVFLLLEIIR